MRALVTGAAGFLGSYLMRELRARGDEVVAVVRPSRELEDVAVVKADLRRPPPELAEALGDVDVVYHLAAGVRGSWRATFDTTVLATENLLGAMREAGFGGRLVHVSSFTVYGLNQLPPGATVDESTPLEPQPERRDNYAWAKSWQERLIRRSEASFAELVLVRPGAIYGRESRFVYRLGRQLGDGALMLLGGGNPMPLTYVENTASLLAEAGRHPAAAGEVFNAVDPEIATQREYAGAWRELGDEPLRVLTFPLFAYRAISAALVAARDRSAGRVGPPAFLDPYVMEPSLRRFQFETGKPDRVLGWTAPVSREEAFRRTFAPGPEGSRTAP